MRMFDLKWRFVILFLFLTPIVLFADSDNYYHWCYTKVTAYPSGAGKVYDFGRDNVSLEDFTPDSLDERLFVDSYEIKNSNCSEPCWHLLCAKSTTDKLFAGFYKKINAENGNNVFEKAHTLFNQINGRFGYSVIEPFQQKSANEIIEYPDEPIENIYAIFSSLVAFPEKVMSTEINDSISLGDVSCDKIVNDIGDIVEIKAVPDFGASFDYWDINGEIVKENPLAITVVESTKCIAHFKKEKGWLRYYTLDDNSVYVEVLDPDSICGEIVIPDGVTDISGGTFQNCKNITKIVIPSSIRRIESETFKGCESLKEIDIPETIEFIGKDAFSGTPWYEMQPDGVVNVHHILYAYKGDMPENLHIDVGDNIKVISNSAFENCTNLVSICLPYSLKAIGHKVFAGCTSLSDITFPNFVEEIGTGVFSDTEWWNKQPDGIVYVANVLYGHKGEIPENSNIVVKDGTTMINVGALSSCENICEFIMPEGVLEVKEFAFSNCKGLRRIIFPSTLKSIDSFAFEGCENLISVELPDSISFIGSYVFSNCDKLKKVKWPAGTQVLPSNIFANCVALEEVILPNTVEELEHLSFQGCFNIKSIYCHNIVPPNVVEPFMDPEYSYCFENEVYENATLYVPNGRVENYRNAWEWSSFKNIVEFDAASGILPLEKTGQGLSELYYSLDGKRVMNPSKGIFIRETRYTNGKVKKEKIFFPN